MADPRGALPIWTQAQWAARSAAELDGKDGDDWMYDEGPTDAPKGASVE